MGRADSILGRFPAHFEALKPGKVLRSAVGALARDLDVQAAELAAIRRSHRLFDADVLSDLLLIAARHGIMASSLELLTMRFERARGLLKDLAAAADEAARDEAAARLLALWSLEGGEPKLALFADPNEDGSPVDLTGEAGATATARLIAAATEASSRQAQNDAARTRIATTIRIAASGNGTVRALLSGAANALDLDIGPIKSSADRYLHASFAFDRLTLRAEGADGPIEPAVAREVIGLEENPLYRVETDAAPRKHAELFDQLRRGFERATLQIRVTGEGVRTVGPMVVNRDEGHGVGYAGSVPGGERLTFSEDGRVTLGEDDVTSSAFAWQGACFADAATPHVNDYVFTEEADAPRAASLCGCIPGRRAQLRLRLSACRRQSADAGSLRSAAPASPSSCRRRTPRSARRRDRPAGAAWRRVRRSDSWTDRCLRRVPTKRASLRRSYRCPGSNAARMRCAS